MLKERILKIGRHLPKLFTNVKWPTTFLRHSVDAVVITIIINYCHQHALQREQQVTTSTPNFQPLSYINKEATCASFRVCQ